MPSTWDALEALTKVFIVQIGSWRGNESVTGAAYWKEEDAQSEVKRLNTSNKAMRAYYVCREVG